MTLVVLIIGGKDALKALQAASIAGALPFTFVIIAMAWGLVKALNAEVREQIEKEEKMLGTSQHNFD